MKTSEAKISSSAVHFQQRANEPFFRKQGQESFFSKSNEAKQSFFRPAIIQPKLTIGKPNDKYEQEADAIADKVVQRLATPDVQSKKEIAVQAKSVAAAVTPLVQTKCATCEHEEKLQEKEKVDDKDLLKDKVQKKPIFESNVEPSDDDKNIQRKCTECEKEENLQKKSGSTPQTTSPDIESSLNSVKGSGNPLPVATREQMENSFGADFSDVRIHNDISAVRMSKDLNAQAFTHGSDIYFNSGKYDANSEPGKHLLAHELTHTVQQGGTSNGIQKQDAPIEHLTSLNEMLNRVDVPETQVIDLLRQLTPAEKTTVNSDVTYRIKMAAAFNISEMVRAVIILNPTLIQKLEWVEAAAGSAESIDYPDISFLIVSSSQAERDALKTTRWRDFFVNVCDNSTIITAVTVLHFDLKTQLEWIEEEASPSNIEYSQIQSLIKTAAQPDRDVLKTNHWRDFFVGVCTNKTIITAVTDLHFDLKTQLEWIEEEASPKNIEYSQIKPLVIAALQPDRDVLKTIRWRDFFVGVCDNDTIIDAVIDLNFDIKTKLEWLMEEGTHYSGFKKLLLAASAADKATILADAAFLRVLKDYFSTWNNFAKTVELLGRVIPNAGSLMADPTVQATLASAWAASAAALTCGGGATTAHEEGGWIYLNLITNAITTQRAVAGAQASINLWGPPDVADSVIVGTFHTHPNVGPCWGAPFASPADVTNANNRGVPNIVRGAFPAVVNTSDVFGGPSQRLHLAGSTLFPGTSGGDEPQSPKNGEYDFE